MSTTQEIPIDSTVRVKPDKKGDFDQLFSGKPCMNTGLTFNVVAMPKANTITVKSELAGTFDSEHTNDAHKFDANVSLFELTNV